jgi:hypothetical protein
MTRENVSSDDLDAWQSERNLDRMRAPTRHAIAAWLLAAVLALTAILGPPATRQVVAGLVELRHEVLMLDRELDRMTVFFQSGCREVFPVAPAVVAGAEKDQTERVD